MVSLNLELGVGKAIFSIFDLGSSYWIVLGMINLNDKIFYMRGVDVVYPSLELNPYVIGNFRKLEKTDGISGDCLSLSWATEGIINIKYRK